MRTRVAAVLAATLLTVVGAGPAVARPARPAGDPPFTVPTATLAAALDCPATFTHPQHEPVLLVHGTFTSGQEQWSWNYGLLLPARGFDVCTVTYPDRGLGDMQVSAEYVAYAIDAIHARTGARVDVVGHSQGGLLPRWAIKYWPSARAAVDDFVMLASPNHGVQMAGRGSLPTGMPAVFFQFDPGSHFLAALNAGDETPGHISYSSLYSVFKDELVQPDGPVPTAALDWQHTGPNTRNLAIQAVCPGRFVDHLTIGTTDRVTQELVIDALTHPGPVDPTRVDPGTLCALPNQYVVPATLTALYAQFFVSLRSGFPGTHMTHHEPPLAAYAQ
jgi:triacylglycerol esterase/lipase EstA (alpha/beta hydrolase family)